MISCYGAGFDSPPAPMDYRKELTMAEHINHPNHYNKPGRKECIEEMLEIFGPDAVYWFCMLSAYKYQYRAGRKEGQPAERDLAKIEWYKDFAARLVTEGRVKHED